MGYTYSFADDKTYGATDLNNLVAKLVTSGVADDFVDGVPYNASILNRIVAKKSTPGVVPSNMNGMKVVTNTTSSVKIQSGTAFFDNGMIMEIDSSGEVLSYTKGKKHYVYLEYDDVLCACKPMCTQTEPGENTVLLAEISTTSEITDRRMYAKGKLPGYMSDYCLPVIVKDVLFEQGTHTYEFPGERNVFVIVGYNRSNLSAINCFTVWTRHDDKYYTWVDVSPRRIAGTNTNMPLCREDTVIAYVYFTYENDVLTCKVESRFTGGFVRDSEFVIMGF